MSSNEIYEILRTALYEFPVLDIKYSIPEWVHILDNQNDIKKEYPKISLDVLNVLKKKNQMYELRDDRGTLDKILRC